MKVRHCISSLVFVLGFLLNFTMSFAQLNDSSAVSKVKNNTVGVIFSLHEFFDGSPIIQPPYPRTLAWTNLAFGLDYWRRLKGRHGIEVSATVSGIMYWYTTSYPAKSGDVFERLYLFSEAAYLYELLSTRRTSLYSMVGANFRYGHELVRVGKINNELFLYDYGCRDLGATAGLRGTQVLFWNIALSAELKFTQYIYRYANHQDQLYTFPNRPTSNM